MVGLVLLVTALFLAVPVQSSGEIGDPFHSVGASLANRLSALMSSCCVISDLRCSSNRLSVSAVYRNSSDDISAAFDRFKHCVCASGRQCVLVYPAVFLPDGADGVSYDATFITAAVTSRYACSYKGSRLLVCQRQQSASTDLARWVMPVGRGHDPLAAMATAGLLGEDMLEIMEEMTESGVYPPPARQPSGPCRRCVPLQCAVGAWREAARRRAYLQPVDSSLRQRFHQCLRRHSIRPPQSYATTTTPPPFQNSSSAPSSSTTHSPRTTTLTSSTTLSTSTTTRSTGSTTPRTSPTTTKPSPHVPPTTLAVTPPSSPALPSTTDTTKPGVEKVGSSTSSVLEMTFTRSRTPSVVTSGPEVVTRTFVGPESGSTAPQQRRAVDHATEDRGGKTAEGGAGVVAVVVGVLAALAVLAACLFFLFLRRRRQQKRKEHLNSSMSSTAAPRGLPPMAATGVHYRARPLPSLSSKIGSKSGKAGASGCNVRGEDNNNTDADRYATTSTIMAASTPKATITLKSSQTGDDDSVYASLDEAAMMPCHQTLAVRSAGRAQRDGADQVSLHSSQYYNTAQPVRASPTELSVQQGVAGRHNSYYNLEPGRDAPPASHAKLGECASVKATSDTSHYEHPCPTHGHEYTSLEKGRFCVAEPSLNKLSGKDEPSDPSYLQPCPPSNLSQGKLGRGARQSRKTRNSEKAKNGASSTKRSSETAATSRGRCSNDTTGDRQSSGQDASPKNQLQRRVNLSATGRGVVAADLDKESRTADDQASAHVQGSSSIVTFYRRVPSTDDDGYLVPSPPSTQTTARH